MLNEPEEGAHAGAPPGGSASARAELHEVFRAEPVEPDDLPYDLRTAHTFDLVKDFEGGLNRLKAALQDNQGAVKVDEEPANRDITITLQANLTDLDTNKLVELIARLVDVGIKDIKVVNVSTR